MSGVSIPIGADLGDFKAEMSALISEIRALTGSINRAFAPAAQSAAKVARETQQAGRAAKRSKTDFMGAAQGLTAIGANVAQISTGVAQFQAIKAGASKAVVSFRALAKSPAFKKIAAGAAVAVTAIAGTVAAVKTVKLAFRTMKRVAIGTFRGIKKTATMAFNGIRGAARGLARVITGGGFMGGAIRLAGVAGAVAVATSQLKGAFGAATGFEDMQVRMEQFVGDAGKARDLIEEMTDFSTATPFETMDVLGSTSKLLSAGIGGNIGQLTRDIAAVAKDGQQLGELADAVAKGFAKGKFQTEELNKFLERGINLMPELAAVTGLTGDALKKAIESGLSFDQVTAAISNLSKEGGQFFGLLERQSRTTTGLISTLKSAWDEVRRAFAQPILDALKPVLDGAIDRINQMRDTAARVGAQIRDVFLSAFVMIRDGNAMEVLKVGFRLAVTGAVDVLMRGLRSAVAFLAAAVPPIFEMAMSKLRDPMFWEGIGNLLQSAANALTAAIQEALGNSRPAVAFRNASVTNRRIARDQLRMAGDGQEIGTVLADSLEAGLKAAAKAGLGPASPGFRAAVENWKGLMGQVSGEVQKLKSQTKIPGVSAGATGGGPGTRFEGGDMTDVAGRSGPGSFSFGGALTRIGGGGLGGMVTPMVSQQQKTNRLLGQIRDKVADSGGMTLKFAS
jgi:tape measure domain-containing protein